MSTCRQTQSMNMLEHGTRVHDSYLQLWGDLVASEFGKNEPALQAWFDRIRHAMPSALLEPEKLRAYHVYHDCGKHLVICTDETGRRHFPEHAAASAVQYAAIFPDDHRSYDLIAHDMDFHTMRGEDLRTLWTHPLAATLYLTAWAEIRANAAMFGGFDSESYKIKRSRLLQAAKKCNVPVPSPVFS